MDKFSINEVFDKYIVADILYKIEDPLTKSLLPLVCKQWKDELRSSNNCQYTINDKLANSAKSGYYAS